MKQGGKVKVLAGSFKGSTGVIENTFTNRGKELYIVKIFKQDAFVNGGWDNYRTTVTADEMEQIV